MRNIMTGTDTNLQPVRTRHAMHHERSKISGSMSEPSTPTVSASLVSNCNTARLGALRPATMNFSMFWILECEMREDDACNINQLSMITREVIPVI